MVMAGSGIDDHAAIIGDWMPPTPSPRTLFSSVLGTEFDGKTPGGNGSDGHFLGRSEHVASNTNGQFTQSNASSPEHKFNSRGGLVERMAARAGFNAPKLNTENIRSSDLSLNSDVRSPYLTIPPGLSPTTLLESPVFLSNSLAQPSPTTGKFPFLPNVNARSSLLISEASDGHKDNLFEDTNASPFEFKPLAESASSFSLGGAGKISQATVPQKRFSSIEGSVHSENSSQSQSVDPIKPHSQNQNNLQPDFFRSSTENGIGPNTNPMNTRVSDMAGGSEGDRKGGGDSVAGGVPSEDGYNWRKYGQKQVKGSENPRSYYKCTFPNCPTKKKVETALDGHITEIVYKGTHSHPKPQSTKRSSSHLIQPSASASSSQMEPVTTPENSSVSMGEDDFDPSSPLSKSGDEENEPDAKRWKGENESEGVSAMESRTVREPRIVVQTTSEIDILDDGYRWRKYGQKVVKGNPNPRSYYKCTTVGCPVRKHVERASHDSRAVLTTYEGKHNHDVPAARGSGSHTLNRPPFSSNATVPMAIRASANTQHPNFHQSSYPKPTENFRPQPTSQSQAPFTLEMLQQAPGTFGFSGFGNPLGSYMNQMQHTNGSFSQAKEEPRDEFDSFFRSD
uniref:WRKY transcription factor 41 n=1 Tax=Santalum album TaxID=35974 RepID=A0A650C388_SANAL|nr:WRKY transcription factor 41 [Santalum album]